MMRPEESFELSRCVYRSYGYSYDWDYVYYPDRIQELQESGLMRSCIVVTPEGELVGHLALTLESVNSPVAEAGQAVVDPRYRGHQLFERMKTFLAERAKEWDMYGLYSEATAVHPYSQKGTSTSVPKRPGTCWVTSRPPFPTRRSAKIRGTAWVRSFVLHASQYRAEA
jgi:serine/threonine-protein kinase RsbW